METASIDLKDAHHVPIAAASRDLLGFTFDGSVYRFKARPFRLKPAPRLFMRLVGCVAAFLRQRGLRFFCYLNVWLLVASSPPPPPPATAAPGPPVADSAGPGVPYKLGQVGARPDSVPDFPRGDYRYPPAAGAAQPEEDRHNRGGGPAAPWSTATSCIFSGTIDRAGTPYPDGSPCPRRSASSSGGGAVRNSFARATH